MLGVICEKKKVAATVNEKVQDDSETCYDVWFVDIDSEKKKTGDGGGRVEGIKVFTERHQDGRD